MLLQKQVEADVGRCEGAPPGDGVLWPAKTGFYHFDERTCGVDTTRFPEFTPAVKEGMYDEAVSVLRAHHCKERPVSELLRADYRFSMSRWRSITV